LYRDKKFFLDHGMVPLSVAAEQRIRTRPEGSLPLLAIPAPHAHFSRPEKNAAHLFGSAEMKFRLIEDPREMFPVRVLCDVMGGFPAE
jgi:hypothetical protein